MRKRQADAIGQPPDSSSRPDGQPDQLVAPDGLMAATILEEARTIEADAAAAGRPSAAAERVATATGSATAASAAFAPFSRLATIELRLVMRFCDQPSLIALARCSRFAMVSASHPFVWQPLSPIALRCDWPLELSGRLRTPKSLLRHADIGVTWRLRSKESVSVEQVAALAALSGLCGLAFESAHDFAADCYTQLIDEGAALLFQSMSERIDHGGALTSLSIFGEMIGQAGGAALAAFVERSRSLRSLKIIGASSALLAPLSVAMTQCRTLTMVSLELQTPAVPSMETVRALATIVQQNSSLTTLTLSDYELDDAAAVALAAAVAQSRSLTDLQLQDGDISDAGVEALVDALGQHGCIRRLDLSHHGVGAAGAEALARLLTCDRCALTSFNVSSNWIERGGALALAEALQTNLTLTDLRLCRIGCGGEGTAALLTALPHNPQCCLRVLDLSSNPLSASRASSLGEVIGRSPTLERLELRSCRLGDEEMAALTAGIGRSRSLQHLDVSDNKFGAPGAAALAAAFATCPSLTSLNVSENQIGDARLAALAPSLINLRALSVKQCGLTVSSARLLAELIRRSLALEYLDVSSNQLDARGVAEIAAALQPSSSLRILRVQTVCGIGARGTAALAAALIRGWQASELWLDRNLALDDPSVLALGTALEQLGSRCTLVSLTVRACSLTSEGALSLVRGAKQTRRLRYLALNCNRCISSWDGLRAACRPQVRCELELWPFA
jgi:Ran GTPase-activating protein (RanGAP) involved in mRNA processing and transport